MYVIGKIVNGNDVKLVIKNVENGNEVVIDNYSKIKNGNDVVEGVIFKLENAEIPKTDEGSYKFRGCVYVPTLKKFVKIYSFIPAGVAAGLIAAKVDGAKYAIVDKNLRREQVQHKTIDKAKTYEIADSNAVATLDKIECVENSGNVEKLEKVSLQL